MFVAPPLDAYEIRRLALIAGCIVAAAVANFAGSAMPQRTPVAVGSALLGALLVLRRRRAGGVAPSQPDATAVEADLAQVAAVPRLRGKRRRDRAAQMEALDRSLVDVRHQLEAHHQRLTSLSGRQTMIDLNTRESLAELLRRVTDLEEDCAQLVMLCDKLRDENRVNLQRLETVFVEHQQAITQLVETYGPRL